MRVSQEERLEIETNKKELVLNRSSKIFSFELTDVNFRVGLEISNFLLNQACSRANGSAGCPWAYCKNDVHPPFQSLNVLCIYIYNVTQCSIVSNDKIILRNLLGGFLSATKEIFRRHHHLASL